MRGGVLMNRSQFSFELVDNLAPKEVIENALIQIGEATQQYVKGKISEYHGEIHSYTKTEGIGDVLSVFHTTNTYEVDIQTELGEISEELNRYEVYLCAKNMNSYKYRLMFVDYGAISYPLTVVLNEELAEEYSDKLGDTFTIATMKQLEELMTKIINSKTLIRLIQSLINESIRRERLKEGEEPSPTIEAESTS